MVFDRETLDHFEHISRSYLHGKRRSSVFKPVTTVDLVSRETSSLTDTYKENLMQTLRCIGIVCLDTGKGCTLLLPFENTVLRDTVWRRYVKQHGEAQSRSFLIEYFTTHQASLRRCEELPWHLKKCRSWSCKLHLIIVNGVPRELIDLTQLKYLLHLIT